MAGTDSAIARRDKDSEKIRTTLVCEITIAGLDEPRNIVRKTKLSQKEPLSHIDLLSGEAFEAVGGRGHDQYLDRVKLMMGYKCRVSRKAIYIYMQLASQIPGHIT